jgi:hypothetical protein
MKRAFAGLCAALCFAVIFLLSLWPARWFSRAPAGRNKEGHR